MAFTTVSYTSDARRRSSLAAAAAGALVQTELPIGDPSSADCLVALRSAGRGETAGSGREAGRAYGV